MDIAIVGIDCRFPGASDLARFWALLVAGETGLIQLSAADRDSAALGESMQSPIFVPVAGSIGEADRFDAEFFGYTPREAAFLDPQQRVFLETCWRALEDAAQNPSATARTGVFAGAGLSTYLLNNVAPVLADGDETDAFLAYTANDKDFLATRVAFKLDLKGPAITVQTACSTSLVAVHLACQSLLLGECDMALAGGITIRVPENVGYHPVPDGIESLDGRCRPFDIQASGTVFSNGAGVMVLKRLSDAVASGDRIYAVIKGTAVNNDGFVKAGFTAPSAAGQAAVIAEALAVADVAADSISFVETHGTGTALGDGVELAALRRVFADCPAQGCALGATKANIGHADVAAGIAGLIKATLSLYHRTLPPMASWETWGSALERDTGPFYVPTKATPLVPRGGILRAGVSAFGVGGTNAHVVLEAPPAAAAAATDERPQLLVLSSRDAAALSRQIKNLAEAIPSAGPLADESWTLQTGRAALAERACVAVRDVAEAARDLSEPQRVRTNRATDPPPRLAFLFPGQGAQFAGMGRTLYRDELVFAATIDAAAQRLRPALGFDLREALFADTHDLAARLRLRETAVSQPAVFAINIAMLNLLRDWGLIPDVVLGHSLGEYAAMVAAGVLSFDDALDIVAERGRLMQALPGGAMAAVLAPAEQVRRLLASGAEISAVNGPSDSVICGPAAAVAATTDVLNRMGIATRTLETSHAFHSAMIEPMLGELARFAADRPRASPQIGLISNLTGALLRTAPDGAYFADHARQPVRFADGISTLLAEGPIAALEVGPGTALSSLARRQGLKGVCATMPPAGDRQAVLEAVGVLWCAGLSPDWTKLHRPPRARVSLPPYPFAKTRHWIEAQTVRTPRRPATRELDIRIAGWRRHHPEPGTLPQGHYAIVGADDNSSRRLADRLEQLGAIAQIGVDHAREPITCLIVTSLQEAELPALLERALAGGRLRDCLFLLPGLFDVDGSELLSADAAALAGLALALAREQPEIAVRIADPGTADPAALLPLLFAAPKPFSAWRRQSCWVPDFQPFALLPAAKQSAGLAYLVIGATGTVGRIAAAAIAAADPTGTIYLASRRGGAIPGVAGEPRRIDVRNPGPLIDEIVARHGRIGGVIFAAGSLSASTFAAVTEPLPTDYRLVKREGLAALVDALEGVRCQFVIVCGSISCWLGGTGYGGYAGANLAAASIARTAARAQDTRWITLSLDAIAGSASPRPGLPEIQADQLAQVLMGSITATSLSGAEIVVAASDFSARYTDFAHAIGQGAAAPDVTPGEPGAVNADPVAEAWRAVLGIDDAKDDDSFFGLGGSSLQALQLLARLQRGAGIDLRLATFLQTPTLAALRLQVAASPAASAVVVAPTVDGPPPLTEGQLSLWLSEQRKETAGRFNITGLYRMDGVADVGALRTAFATIEARHEALRTRFVERDGRPVQVIDAPGRCIVSEETIAAEQLEACLSEEVFRRMDIAIEPPWRVRLLDAGSAGRFLMLSAHHLLLDDWSIGLFFKELAEAYDAASTNQPAQISPPVRGFSEFCRVQAEMSRAGRYDGSLEHWRRRLADAPHRLPLQPPLSSREADGALPVHLDAATIHALRAIGERRGTSLFTVLLAVFKTCLAGETGARDVVVGVPQAGRPAGDWDRVLGYFVNPAALRTDVSEAADFLSLVTTVKAAVIDATAHDQVPYERVAAALGSRNLFNVWFTILTHADPCIMSGGLKLAPTRLGPRPSRFDVALVLEPDGEGLTGWLEYSGALVARKAAQRLVARFGNVIERITVRPETPMALLLGVDLTANSIIDLPTTRLDLAGRLRQRRSLSDWRSSGGQ